MEKTKKDVQLQALLAMVLGLACYAVAGARPQWFCGKQNGNTTCGAGHCCGMSGRCSVGAELCGPGKCQSQCPVGLAVADLVTQELFEQMLPHRGGAAACPTNGIDAYGGFIDATNKFAMFGRESTGGGGDRDAGAREVAAFLAQLSQQVGVGPTCCPEMMLATYPPIAFTTALWGWMSSPAPKRPSCHQVASGLWKPTEEDLLAGRVPGYGIITNILSGGRKSGRPRADDDKVRVYERFCRILGVSPGPNLHCYSQKPF